MKMRSRFSNVLRPWLFLMTAIAFLAVPLSPLKGECTNEWDFPEHPWSPRTLQGKAFLNKPISDAILEIYDLFGWLLYSSTTATGQDGSFSVTRPLPRAFRIVVSGGMIGENPFEHALVSIVTDFNEQKAYNVNAITTLVAEYQSRHLFSPKGCTTAIIKDFLSIPASVNLEEVIKSTRWFSYYFSHHQFMKEAEAYGDIGGFFDDLVDQCEQGETVSFYATESIGSSLFQDALSLLLKGSLSKIGSDGTGGFWVS